MTFVLVLIIIGCQEDEPELGSIVTLGDLSVSSNVSDDGSGIVEFTATAEDAITYKYVFGDGTSEVSPSGIITKTFTKTGLNTYLITVVAYGTEDNSTTITIEIEVEVEVQGDFADEEAKQLLSGGNIKTWYLATAEPGHLGVGFTIEQRPGAYWFATEFSAYPYQFCENSDTNCFCDDELIFALLGDNLTYQLDNKGQTFFNGANSAAGGGDGSGGDICLDFEIMGTSIVNLVSSPNGLPEGRTRGTLMNFTNDGFMGYYVGSSSYEILSITNNFLYVRSYDASNPALAWYLKFSTTPPGTEGEESLVWEDDFNTDGAPDPLNWTYDLGAGGWGNGEAQTYTNNPSNVIVEDGLLKIIAKADGSGGFTSARLKSENLQEFTYGRVEVRAKLPAVAGTWPAIWALGANFDTVGWPTCGEIDIMEQTGWDKNTTLSTLHFPGNYGGGGITNSTTVSTATTEFHNYTVEWTPDVIEFWVDDNPIHNSFANTSGTPFNSDFFFILNVAIGGTLGGAIDPGFTEDIMEVDYIRVYQ